MAEIPRAAPRKKRRFQVRYTDAKGVTRIGFTHDVSVSGLFVTAGNLPPVGQDLVLELQAPGGRNVTVSGRVVRQKRVPQALTGTIPNGFGLGLTGSYADYATLVAAL